MNLPHAHIVAAVHDLMFASRIRAAALHAGVEVLFARSNDELHDRAAAARRVLIDLEARWLDAPTAIAALKAARPEVDVIAFGSHVLGEQLQAARDAGADRVLARSAFVKQLPDLLGG